MDEEIKKSVLKSGTSILGIVCKDGIIMASDRRATAGNLVLAKNIQKTIKVTDYVVVSGTGGAADIEMLQKIVRAELKLKELKSRTRPTVSEAANLIGMLSFKNIRQFSTIPSVAGTLIAGFNEDGSSELYSIEPAGSVMKIEDYDANFSSGMPFILGLLERSYTKDLTVKEAVELALECLKSSTQRDVGSGFGIDVFVINKEGIKKEVEQEIRAEYVSKKQ